MPRPTDSRPKVAVDHTAARHTSNLDAVLAVRLLWMSFRTFCFSFEARSCLRSYVRLGVAYHDSKLLKGIDQLEGGKICKRSEISRLGEENRSPWLLGGIYIPYYDFPPPPPRTSCDLQVCFASLACLPESLTMMLHLLKFTSRPASSKSRTMSCAS